VTARRSHVLLLCALAALAAHCGTAAARPGYEVAERSLQLKLSPGASNGYAVEIATEGHRRVTLTARKGSASVAYETIGQVSRRGIEADFGKLGHISVRFEGERRPLPGPLPPSLEAQLPDLHLPHRKCHGRKPVREVGNFSGSIRFEGENGFTRIDAQRSRGEVRRFYTRICERFPGSAGRKIPKLPDSILDFGVSILYAADASPSRKVTFEAVGLELGLPGEKGGTIFFSSAKIFERKEGMGISRAALEIGDEGSVILSPPKKSPVTATVALPAPFSGTADYRKERGSPSGWSGSLAFHAPGDGLVPLAGPDFSAALCRVSLSDLLESHCLRRAGVPLPAQVKSAPPIAARPGGLERALLRAAAPSPRPSGR
jgi:hypothetical protein